MNCATISGALTIIVGLGLMLFGAATTTPKGNYLSTDDLKQWRPMTPEEADRSNVPLTQNNARKRGV